MSNDFHNRAKELFFEARKKEASKRAAFVKKSARGDSALEKEVLDLLENDVEDTILSRDQAAKPIDVLVPSGLENLASKSAPNKLFQTLFSTRGRAGIAFLVIALIIGLLGLLAAQKTKQQLAEIRGEETRAILESNVQALEYWIKNYQRSTEIVVRDQEIVEAITHLEQDRKNASLAHQLDSLLKPYLPITQAHEYIITDLTGEVLLLSGKLDFGDRVDDRFGKQLYAVVGGKSQFILPFYANPENAPAAHKPLVWMQVPVYDNAQNIVATFGIGRRAERDFTKILRTARMGNSGETYAINKEGFFISESRFEDDMRNKGMMHTDTNVSSILNLSARLKNALGTQILPFTALAEKAVSTAESGDSEKMGVVLNPGEDYKGVHVIGSWAWLPKYEFGVITQIDAKEAFAPVKYIYILIGIAVFLMLAAASFSFYNANQLLAVTGALNSATAFGQYDLIKMIAEGGMGSVYFGQHRLLKRPTAIKVIRVDRQDELLAQRFEREVKLASQLSHPNTIEIFDYGFAKSGQAYCAMEFVNGINLSEAVKRGGAMEPSRIIYLLRQICGSLLEAHTLGLVHRDIKPQNIMISNKIGIHDFVKVLDFGLAKPFVDTSEIEETRAITGTPVYIAPERLKRPGLAEPSADIYAVGALAYFLLAGYPIFSFSSDLDLLYQVLNETPKALPEEAPKQLANLIMFCLEKDPENRPISIEELKLFLDNMANDAPWTAEQAEDWWRRFGS